MSFERSRHGKRPRRESSGDLQVEELSPDDMGYDGDVEILRPDHYEEVESDFEDEAGQIQKQVEWPDADEELARKLRRLRCDPPPSSSPKMDNGERGLKRQSVAMDEEGSRAQFPTSELEVSELVEGQTQHPPPSKRRKKRSSQQIMAHRLARKQAGNTWSDTTDTERTDETLRELLAFGSSREATPDVTTTTTAAEMSLEGDDVMDIG